MLHTEEAKRAHAAAMEALEEGEMLINSPQPRPPSHPPTPQSAALPLPPMQPPAASALPLPSRASLLAGELSLTLRPMWKVHLGTSLGWYQPNLVPTQPICCLYCLVGL